MDIIVNSAIDQGKRPYQEDCFVELVSYLPGVDLYLMADGMGGEGDGDFAANMFVSIFEIAFKEFLNNEENVEMAFAACLAYSNKKLLDLIREQNKSKTAGSTFIACMIKDDKIHLLSVGDSLIFAINQTNHTCITNERHEDKQGYLTSCTGAGLTKYWYKAIDLIEDLVIILATDGLEQQTRRMSIAEFIRLVDNLQPSTAAEALVQTTLSINHPQQDNIAVISIVTM